MQLRWPSVLKFEREGFSPRRRGTSINFMNVTQELGARVARLNDYFVSDFCHLLFEREQEYILLLFNLRVG